MHSISFLLLLIQFFSGLSIIVLTLLQRGRGAEIGAVFSGSSSGSLLSIRGSSNFLSSTTAVMAGLFFSSTLLLTYFSSKDRVRSVADEATALKVGISSNDFFASDIREK